MKIGYFIKEKRSKWKRHTSSTQRKTLKTQVARNQIGKQQISTPQISTNTQRFQLQELSNNRATECPQKPAQSRATEFHFPSHRSQQP
jgi:hypothetical protein